jgi:C4-dicarboxylate-specific signal transduction histidine kinase
LTEANLRLQAEMAEHRATEAALHQAQKLEAMGHLAGGIAHDFNNLPTVVVSNATLLLDCAADEPTRRRAAAILSIADRGERLIRQLLAFSRRRMLRPEAVALQGRTSEIAELLARSLREDIAVTIHLPPDLWPVTVDPGEIDRSVLPSRDASVSRVWRGSDRSSSSQRWALPRASIRIARALGGRQSLRSRLG